MLKNEYIARMNALFYQKGISQKQSEQLVEELQDHLALRIAELHAKGNSVVDSECAAMEVMGAPEEIAEKAAVDLQGGWKMRFAWLLCGGGVSLLSLVTMIAIILLGYYLAGSYGYDCSVSSRVNLAVYQIEAVCFNWLPLLIGMAGLAFMIRYSSIGWRSIFFTAIALGIVVSAEAVRFKIGTVVHSTKLSFLEMDESFIVQWLGLGSGRFLDHEPVLLTMFRLFAPVGMCFFARYVQPCVVRRGGRRNSFFS